MSSYTRPLMAVLLLTLTACSGGGATSRIDYKEAKGLAGLDVPPDLAMPVNYGNTELPASAVVAEGEVAATSILPKVEGVRVVRDGADRWLVLDAPAEELWPRLRSFWSSLGLALKMDQAALGIMETDWAENRADAPGGFLTGMVKKVFKNAYSAGTRDKYRLRLERLDGQRSELYLTHYGLKEIVTNQQSEISGTAWETRPSDPELTNEILNRLIIFLGGREQLARKILSAEADSMPARAHLSGDLLAVDEGFSRTWRRTGIALDRQGLVVEDRNRSRGIYYVRESLAEDEVQGKKGWFSGWFGSSKKTSEESGKPQWQVVVRGNERESRIAIFSMEGEQLRDETAVAMLKRLLDELK